MTSGARAARYGESRLPTYGYGLALSLVAFLAFSPILGNGFVNYDDPSYVTANPRVTGGLSADGIRWAFGGFHFYNWHPLTWVSHMLDVEVFGLNPAGHHLVSLLLHTANTILLFLFFQGATGKPARSAFLAALFALHPLHVESVAWVSGRKDLLCTFFMFLALFAWRRYAQSGKTAPYLLCTFLFALGLMTKGMLVTFPFVLLLVDFWPLGRIGSGPSDSGERGAAARRTTIKRALLEKVPMAAMAVGSAIVTFLAQLEGGAIPVDGSPFAAAANAIRSYVAYIFKMLWPAGLAVYYPYDPVSSWSAVLALAFVVAVSVAVARAAGRFPWFFVGWFWYLGTYFPVAGFVRLGQHAMADRYTYIPLIGLFIMVVWGTAERLGRSEIPRRALAGTAIAVLGTCAVVAHRQAAIWRDSVTLFRHALEVTENNALAHKNLGAALAAQGKYEEALFHVTEALRIQPESKGYVSQASLYLQFGEYARALQACERSIAMDPSDGKAHFLAGVSRIHLGDARSAFEEYRILRGLGSPYADRLLDHLRSAGVAAHVP